MCDLRLLDPLHMQFMKTFEKSITINVYVSQVYDQLTQFEEFPYFMEGVKEVKQMDDKRLHWKAEIAGRTQVWEAEITEQIPDLRLAWRNTSGAENSRVISFSAQGAYRTYLNLEVQYEPEGLFENLDEAPGLVSARVSSDLSRFKHFVETRHSTNGGWRGEVSHPAEPAIARFW